MAHWSEEFQKLKTIQFSIENLQQLEDYQSFAPNVYLFHFVCELCAGIYFI